MELQISIPESRYQYLRSLLSPEQFRNACWNAIKRTGGNVRKNLRRYLRAVSFLKSGEIASAIGKVRFANSNHAVEAAVTVSGRNKVASNFKLVPNRITARKGKRSINWLSPGVLIGPNERIRKPALAGYSKPFIAKTKKLKAMYLRDESTGDLLMPEVASPQYFAAFDQVKDWVAEDAKETFQKRFEHEIDYRLGLGR